MPTCTGRATQNAHPIEQMVFVTNWKLQGRNQKTPMLIELWKCPTCGKCVKKALKCKA